MRSSWFEPLHIARALLVLAALNGPPVCGAGEEDDAERIRPDRKELWVPTNRLGEVLKSDPKAVLLSRDQYEKLLREAAPKDPKTNQPPRSAALVSATYAGKVEGNVLTVQGELVAEVLGDDWARLPLHFGSLALGEVKVEGEGALALPAPVRGDLQQKAKQAPARPPDLNARAESPTESAPTLLLHGKGKRKVSLRFSTAVRTTDGWRGASLTLPGAGATSLTLDLPAHTLAMCAQPMRTEELPGATRLTIALPADSCDVVLRWRSSGGGLNPLPLAVHSQTTFTIDSESVQARSDLVISTATGVLPETLEFPLPKDGRLVEVIGSDVAGSRVEGQRVLLTLPPGRGSRVAFTTLVQRPTALPPAGSDVALPLPEFTGAGRVDGEFSVYTGPGVLVRELAKTPGTTPLAPQRGLAGHWYFLGAGVAPQIRVEPLRPRFHADLDTLFDFQPEAVFVERTVTLHPEEGGLYNLLLTLPGSEEVLSVQAVRPPAPAVANLAGTLPAEPDPLWTVHDGRLLLRWLADPQPGRLRTVLIRTRTEPAGWAASVGRSNAGPKGAPATFSFPVTEAVIEGAEKVSGYIALRSSENFRLEAEAGETLEQRDGRTTPVFGTFAWFRRGAFDLKVSVTRRASELLATVTGYALPLAGVLDLHAQLAWQFRYSGVRSVQVRVPEALAEQFHFEGPQIAERTLAGDTWTITFQKELTGEQSLSVTAQIPISRAADDQSRFSTTIPVIEPLGAERVSGTWSVEANTDTEIQLKSTGMNEVDALLAPALPGYQPRHRVIGVFTWLGSKYGLELSGVRHEGAGVLKTVVDTLDLTSVVASTGIVRHDASITLRTAGAQFLDLTLPEGARLLSLLVDEEPSKPVGGKAGEVRVQLPASPDPLRPTRLRIVYENAGGAEWKNRGRALLSPLRLPAEVPVLQTSWRAYLPQGFYYSGGLQNFTEASETWERPLVMAPLELWKLLRVTRRFSIAGSSGIADPRPQPTPRPGEVPLLNRLSQLGGNGRLAVEDGENGNERERLGKGKLAISQNAIDALQFESDETPKQPRSEAKPGEEDFSRAITGTLVSPNSATPDLRKKIEQVQTLMTESRSFFDIGRYDLAYKRTEQVLALDPNNIAARKLQEVINLKRTDYAVSSYNQTRSFETWQVTQAWNKPVRLFGSNLPISGEEARKVGLLPMRLELPRVGEQVLMAGFGAPEPVEVQYFAEGARSRGLLWWFLCGAAGYALLGGRHPWWRTAWVALLLTAIPLCISPGATAISNLLLAGWLAGLLLGRFSRRFIFGRRMESEAAV